MAELGLKSRSVSSHCFSVDWNHGKQGALSFIDFFKSIVANVVPSLSEDELKLPDGSQGFGNGNLEDSGRNGSGVLVGQTFAEATLLLPLYKDAQSELVELCYKVDSQLERLKDKVSNYDMKHEEKFVELIAGETSEWGPSLVNFTTQLSFALEGNSVEVGTKKNLQPKPDWMKMVLRGGDKYAAIKSKL